MLGNRNFSARTLFTLFFLALLGGSIGCEKDKAEPPPGMNGGNSNKMDSSACDSLFSSFSQDVQPIFTGSCAEATCHTSNNTAPPEGIVLETYSQIRDEVMNGNVMCAIRHEVACENMPDDMSEQLPQEEIEAIQCWIDAGYPND